MANVSHSTLAGVDLHEPKGVSVATSGQVYIADGGGSGAWTTIVGLSFTGMIADFLAPSPPAGWLELDGSAISSTTYAALYSVMTVQQTGSRSGGSAIITGLASTTNIKAGYSIAGTGIPGGLSVLSVNSATQITMSGNASSSGSATVVVSPWVLGSGTITLPDTTTAGRFRRSRTSSTTLGTTQGSQNLSHTHPFTSDSTGSVAATVAGETTDHTHTIEVASTAINYSPGGSSSGTLLAAGSGTVFASGGRSAGHIHGVIVPNHVHSGTSGSTGSSEARPVSIVVLTCVKT